MGVGGELDRIAFGPLAFGRMVPPHLKLGEIVIKEVAYETGIGTELNLDGSQEHGYSHDGDKNNGTRMMWPRMLSM